jgi:hypothetical protein
MLLKKIGLKNSPDGCRVIVMDNRYSSSILFVTLLRHYGIAAIGTVRKNRKGLDKDMLIMTKRAERGACKAFYDKTAKILCVQWNDNKVVTVISSAWLKGRCDIQRRIGTELRTFSTEKCILAYQKSMLGVDKSDQRRIQAGGFKNSLKPNKWFKAGIFGVLDFALTNASVAWNIRAKEIPGSMENLTQSDFLHCLTDQLLNYPSDDEIQIQLHHTSSSELSLQPASSSSSSSPSDQSSNQRMNQLHTPHQPLEVSNNKRNYCKICSLENDFRAMWFMKGSKGNGGFRTQKDLRYCAACKIYAHDIKRNSSNDLLIFDIPQFHGLSCFEIAHHELCNGLFNISKGKKKYTTVDKKHHIYSMLMDLYIEKFGESHITRKDLMKNRTEKRKDRERRRHERGNNEELDEDCYDNDNEHDDEYVEDMSRQFLES